MRALLAASSRPTAVVCGNDQLAFGAMIEAKANGLTIPHDISIVGFNDLDFAAYLDPPLTTVFVPTDQIGVISGEYLVGRANDQPVLRVNEIPTKACGPGKRGRPQPAHGQTGKIHFLTTATIGKLRKSPISSIELTHDKGTLE